MPCGVNPDLANYSPVNILLSHDPSHWRKEVINKYPNINLTLSGHTHGMQFGVEVMVSNGARYSMYIRNGPVCIRKIISTCT